MCARVRSALALEQDIPAAWLFTHQTIRLLADKISRDVLSDGGPKLAPLLPAVSSKLAAAGGGLDEPTALSFQQVQS